MRSSQTRSIICAERPRPNLKPWRQDFSCLIGAPLRLLTAVTDADRLVGETMHARGYPLGDFDQRADDISVDHPSVVMNYRAAREIAQRHSRGEANTEDLRQAMVHYRVLFMDLLETHEPLTDEKTTPPEHEHARRA
jgi:hypothetical protein